MIRLLRLRSLALVGCCLVFSATAYADPITIGFGEDTNAFSLTVTGSPITGTVTYGMILGASWEITFTITETAALTDRLAVSGTAQHIKAPHDEPAGPTFNFAPDQIGLPLNMPFEIETTFPGPPVSHGSHFDIFIGRLQLVGINGQSTGYTFHLEGKHCTTPSQCPQLPQEKPIPEPATLLLLGTGIAGIAVKLRRRFTSRTSGECSSKPFS